MGTRPVPGAHYGRPRRAGESLDDHAGRGGASADVALARPGERHRRATPERGTGGGPRVAAGLGRPPQDLTIPWGHANVSPASRKELCYVPPPPDTDSARLTLRCLAALLRGESLDPETRDCASTLLATAATEERRQLLYCLLGPAGILERRERQELGTMPQALADAVDPVLLHGRSPPRHARDLALVIPRGLRVRGPMPFFSFRHDCVRTDVQDTCSIANATGVHGHIDHLLLHPQRLTGIRILQQEGATRTALLAAAVALLALTGLPMADNIRALTVGAVQDLDDHCASPSCGCFGASHVGNRSYHINTFATPSRKDSRPRKPPG